MDLDENGYRVIEFVDQNGCVLNLEDALSKIRTEQPDEINKSTVYHLILDVETDGIGTFRPPTQTLCEIGWIFLKNGKEIERYATLNKYRDDITIKNLEYTLHIPLVLDGEISYSYPNNIDQKINIECGSSYDFITDVKVVVSGNMYVDNSDREKIHKGQSLYSFMTFNENKNISYSPRSSLPIKGCQLVNGIVLYAKDRNTIESKVSKSILYY